VRSESAEDDAKITCHLSTRGCVVRVSKSRKHNRSRDVCSCRKYQQIDQKRLDKQEQPNRRQLRLIAQTRRPRVKVTDRQVPYWAGLGMKISADHLGKGAWIVIERVDVEVWVRIERVTREEVNGR
jgi:hypothetical protein